MSAIKYARHADLLLTGEGISVIASAVFALVCATAECSGQGTLLVNFGSGPGVAPPGYRYAISRYTESGMEFWNRYGPGNLVSVGGGVSWNPENGTPYLQVLQGAGLSFDFSSGAHFSLLSFDAGEYDASQPGPVSLRLVGYKSMGMTVTNDFTTDGINDGTGALVDFETFHLDLQFVDVYRIDVLGDRWSVDNVLVGGIPEPSAGGLVVLGLFCGYVWRWIRNKQS